MEQEVMIPESETAVALTSDEQRGLQKYSEDDFDKIAAPSWLPRVQLMTSNTDAAKSGSFPVNHYALIKGKVHIDLGESVDVFVHVWRPKALDTSEGVVSAFDPDCGEFKRIQAASFTKNSGCMFGPEFLITVKGHGLATFFMGSKSSRAEAPNLKAFIPGYATLGKLFVPPKKTNPNSWWTPQVSQCSSEFDYESKDLRTQIDIFNNPPATEIEKVETVTNEPVRG
jgi:hypothetical protein